MSSIPNIRALKKELRSLPVTVARSVAARVAPMLAGNVATAWDSGRTVYDVRRPGSKVTGRPLDLVQTRTARGGVYSQSIGTESILGIRSANYAKYLIGKYEVLPIGNAPIPIRWRREIEAVFREELGAYVAESAARVGR